MAYNNTEQNGPPSTDGPTWRAVITGIGLIILLILGIGYADNVIGGSYLAADHTNIGAVAMLFLILVVFNPLISYLVGRARRLSRGEILTIYLMLVLSSSVVSLGLVSNIIPMISGAFYHAKGNRYQELFHPYLPGHLTVRDPGALKEYYEGKLRKTVELPARPQAGGLSSIAWRLRCWSIKAAAWKDWLAAIPWSVWVRPLAWWCLFLLSLHMTTICGMVILRKQWIRREILVFPMAKLPLALVEMEREEYLLPDIFRNRVFWAGVILPMVLGSLWALTAYRPNLPAPARLYYSGSFLNAIFGQIQPIQIYVSFVILGFAYFVSLEVLLSTWVWALFFLLWLAIVFYFGWRYKEFLGIFSEPDEPLLGHISSGALLCYGLAGLWVARSHLREVLRTALTRASVDDSDEIFSYRSAFSGCLIGLLVMYVWLVFSGIPWIPAGMILFVSLLIFLALSRVIAETGIPQLAATNVATSFTYSKLGFSAFGIEGTAPAMLTYTWNAEIRNFPMAAMGSGLKFLEGLRHPRIRLFVAIVSSLVLSLILGLFIDLFFGNLHGALNRENRQWFIVDLPKNVFNYGVLLNQERPGISWIGWVASAAGACIMLILIVLRRGVLWWPLHPIGFAIRVKRKRPNIYFYALSFCIYNF